MKPAKVIVSIAFVLFILSGCDELIKKDVDVPITFEVFQEIDIPKTNYEISYFDYDGYFDILSHPDIANAIGTPDKIKNIKITKIQYEFKNFSGNVDAVINGDIILPEESFSSNIPFERMFEIAPVKVAESVLLGELYTLNGDFKKVNEYLTQSTIFEYSFSGVSSRNPVNCLMVIHVFATVTVEASLDYKGNFN